MIRSVNNLKTVGHTIAWSLGGYEFGLEIESVLGKIRENDLQRHLINGISISSAFIVFISYLSSHLRICFQ